MFVALDATYVVDPHPSGIAVYSKQLLDGLAFDHPSDSFLHLYRWKQFRNSAQPALPNVQRRLMLPSLPPTLPWKRPDLFHALNQRVDRRAAKRVISTFHDLFVMTGEYSSAEFRSRFSQQARDAAERSDVIIAVSEFTKSQVVDYLKVDPQRISVVPHGVDLPHELTPLENRENIILCVGALQIRKNVVRLVEAMEQIPGSIMAGWKIVLAGSTAGFGAAEIVARIERSTLVSQIELRGYVTMAGLKDLYRRALIFAFPSLDEGFGIPILEAMAYGIPVLTSNRSALPQVAGDAAILVDPYETQEISFQLQRLMEDRELRMNLSNLGRRRAALFPWKRAVRETSSIYSNVGG